jgi:hypothetical protein
VSTPTRQTNFLSGELSPLLWGRTDLSVYSRGARRLKNFFVSHAGAAVSRPGTTMVAEANAFGDGSVNDTPPRLIPFVFSDDEAYVLEFGAVIEGGYIRVYRRGVLVFAITGTSISAEDLPKLKYAQTGNLLTVCVPSTVFTAPMELRRLAPDNWTWEETVFAPPDPQLPDVGASAMANPFNPGSAPAVLTTTPFMLLEPLPVVDDDHPAREWIWGFTAIMQRLTDGLMVESLFQVVSQSTDGVEHLGVDSDPLDRNDLTTHQIPLYPDQPVTLVRLGESLAAPAGYRTLSFRIYRGAGDVFGWIGDTRTRTFVDTGDDPNYAIQPPLGSNPFTFRLHPSGPQPVRTPLSVGFFQERRCFGGALGDDIQVPSQPGHLFCSATGDYYNFDERLAVHVDSEALVFEMASRRWEEIRHLVTLDRMLILTGSSAWSIAGQEGAPLTFQPPDLQVIDEVGSAHVTPLVVDKSALFVRTKGTGARALVPSDRKGGYQGADISLVAHHLFIGHERDIIDWAYAEDPWGLVWAVRRDGTLLSLTYSREAGWGWTQHETDGVVESVCSVPENDEDAVYLLVRRIFNGVEKRFIERMTSRHSRAPDIGDGAAELSDDGLSVVTPPDSICLDCAKPVIVDVEEPGALTGLEHLEGEEVWVVGQGMMPVGPLTVQGGELSLDGFEEQFLFNVGSAAGDRVLVYVGLKYTPELETLDAAEARMQTKVVERVGLEVDQSVGLEAGQDFEHLAEWELRTVEDGYQPIAAATALVDMAVEGDWSQSGRAVLRQTLPLPVTVVGITRLLAKGS